LLFGSGRRVAGTAPTIKNPDNGECAVRSKNHNHSWIDCCSNIKLPRNRLLPGRMRGNDLKELFVYDAGMDVASFTIGSDASGTECRR
jgi:hypothetical protein